MADKLPISDIPIPFDQIERVSSSDLRERFVDVVGKAAYGKQPTIITYYRKDRAAVVPIDMVADLFVAPERKKAVAAAVGPPTRKQFRGRKRRPS